MRLALFAFAVCLSPVLAVAQDQQTLADIRQELTVLNVEIQKLRRELSTTGSANVSVTGSSVLDRMSAIEAEVQRLTSQTEQMDFRIGRIVEDGTNRIGDLEFRLVELEGGDVSALGETSTLGGESQTTAPAPTAVAPGSTTELAVGEADDFKRAQDALTAGDFANAAALFATFNQTYPGGPLSAGAEYGRGEALEGLGDIREAARAYLASFSADPEGTVAPAALFRVGRSLGALGQIEDACVTLREVGARFPQSPAAQDANAQLGALGCN
jgi:tol-pal system protein YbgF